MRIPERLSRKVEAVTESGCWIWTGKTDPAGYCRVCVQGKDWMLHRLYYVAFRGRIPKGLVLDHLCRVRCCVNPYHLEVVTNKENILRGVGACARNKLKTHCNKGHALSGGNLRMERGFRLCVICTRERGRIKWHRAQARRRAAKVGQHVEAQAFLKEREGA